MVFTAESYLVKIWVESVTSGVTKPEDVPVLFNLKDVVLSLI